MNQERESIAAGQQSLNFELYAERGTTMSAKSIYEEKQSGLSAVLGNAYLGGTLYNSPTEYKERLKNQSEENTEIKKDILLISDDPYFFTHATITAMCDFYKTWYPSFNEDDLYKYTDFFSLPLNKPIKDFSKGMKRQTMLAIALAIAPKYLLLDEAFDGLDPVMRLTFKRAITTLIENKDMTVIISSHNLRELEDICDYFGITPKEFFDEDNSNPAKIRELDTVAKHLSSEELEHIITIINDLIKNKQCK